MIDLRRERCIDAAKARMPKRGTLRGENLAMVGLFCRGFPRGTRENLLAISATSLSNASCG